MRANKPNEEDTGKNASSVITIHMLSQDTLLHQASMEMVEYLLEAIQKQGFH